MNKKHFLIVVLAVALVVTLFIFPFKDEVTNKYYCTSDSNCVPEQCCHPTACINENFKPACEGIICTMMCAPETLDCGQGSCICQNNKCTAALE